MRLPIPTTAIVAVLLLAPASASLAQQMASSNPTFGNSYQANSYQRSTRRSNPALDYFGADTASRLASRPRAADALPVPRPVQLRPAAKPFSNLRQGSSISPYLSLDVRESATGVPVYYSLVKPQLDQIQNNQRMQAEYTQMQQQLRSATATGIVSEGPSGGMPTTGHSTQFQNLGGYFPLLR